MLRPEELVEFRNPFQCTNEQLINFVRGCPHLQILHLNPDPLKHDKETAKSQISLLVLPELIRLLPKLTQLRLFVDPSGGSLQDLPATTLPATTLTSISFGTSPLPDETDEWSGPVSFLGRLLPPHCKLDCSEAVHLEPEMLKLNTMDAPYYAECRQRWSRFDKMLRMVMDVRSATLESVQSGATQMSDWEFA